MVQGAGEDVDDVAVGGGLAGHFGEELLRLFEVRHVALLDVVVGSDVLLQVGAADHTGPDGGRPATEQHDAASLVLVGGLQQSHRHGDGSASAAVWALAALGGPAVFG